MYEPLKYIPVRSKPRQEPAPEPAKPGPTLEEICDRIESVVFLYWLLGMCTQGAVIWLLVNIANAM